MRTPTLTSKKNVQTDRQRARIYNIMQCRDGQNYTRDSCCSGDRTWPYYVFVYMYIGILSGCGCYKVPTTSYFYVFILYISIHDDHNNNDSLLNVYPIQSHLTSPKATHTHKYMACERGTLETTVIFGFAYKRIMYIYIYNIDRCVSVSCIRFFPWPYRLW